MLRFANKPDRVFHSIVADALAEAIDNLDMELESITKNTTIFERDENNNNYFEEEIVRSFGGGPDGLRLIGVELKKLLNAHTSDELYMPSDRHFKLLDRVLRVFIDVYNDTAPDYADDPEFKYTIYTDNNGDRILEIDGESVLDFFFWDNDYDLPAATAQGIMRNNEIKNMLRFSETALPSALNALVDTNDLTLEKYIQKPEDVREDGEDEEFLWIDDGSLDPEEDL